MRPELGYETRMRIVFAFLSGMFAMCGLIAVALGSIGGGCVFAAGGSGLMFAAATNRWLIRADS
jgi:hypothetical protein